MKITIDGTEVLCSNDFTIDLEMLNTPSVILNNVYPKSWETDKDYTSNFYHPEDYSQCLIYDQTPILPSEYQEVEYIQSSGTQYIDTGFKPNQDTRTILDFVDNNSGTGFIFGARYAQQNKAYSFLSSNSFNFRFDYNANQLSAGSKTVGNRYKVDFNKNVITINKVAEGTTTSYTAGTGTFNSGCNMYLFNNNTNGSTNQYGKLKLYSFSIYNDEVLVRNFVPCYRKSDNVIGLYDIVNDQFYTNKGTGTFAKGNDTTTYKEDLIFCGVVKNSGDISLNPRYPHYSTLQILDYKTLLSEGETLDFVIANKTILEAINQVINTISPYGFELGEVKILNEDDLIGAYSTKDKTAYDVFNYIADITQSRWTTRTLGVGRVAIDFYDPTLMTQGTAIDYDNTWFKNNDIIDMTYNYGTWDYRNKQVMTSKEVYGNIIQTQTIYYDGYATQLLTEYPIGTITQILVNGNEKTFTTNDEYNLGIVADFHYSTGNNFFEKDMTLYAGNVITISYYPIVEGRQIVNNSVEISRVATATGVKGVIARYENRNDATTSDELQKIGQSYIKYKGVPEIKLTVKTTKNLWNIGDRVQFNAPINDLDTEYMVKRKEMHYIVSADMIFYTFELSSSFNSEQAINYFDNQRSKANGNIKEGEFISRNIDLEDDATIIFYDTDATTLSITPDNELQGDLEMILGG